MSWLDLPPDPATATPPHPALEPGTGLMRVQLGLVAAGMVGLSTEFGVDAWRVPSPAPLASILGVGIVERAPYGDGYVEVGVLDPATGVLRIRGRDPRIGQPRTFQLQRDGMANAALDQWSAWQLARVVDEAIRRGERFELQKAGYPADSPLAIAVSVGAARGGQRRINLSAHPPVIAQRWKGATFGIDVAISRQHAKTLSLPVIPASVATVVDCLVSSIAITGFRPTDLLLAFDTP